MRSSLLASAVALSALVSVTVSSSAQAQPAAQPPPAAPTTPDTTAPAAPAAPIAPAAPTAPVAPTEPTAPLSPAPVVSVTPAAQPPLPYDVLGSAGARAVGLAPVGVNYGNFMDTRLTWTFGDDDFLHPTGQIIPLSPTFSIGDRTQYRLFFDSLNSRYAGRENLTHLVMYKKLPGFIDKMTTEASLVLRFDMTALAQNNNNINQALYDAGSFIRIFYQTGKSEREGLSATFFPLDTDRFRLGYLYDLSWGGTNSNINQSIFPRIQGSSPGLKVQYDGKNHYAFLGFKTASIVQAQQILYPGTNDYETTNVAETNYGFLAGGGYDPTEYLRFDLGAGYFQQGKFDLPDVRGRPVYTYGASARVVVHKDMPVPQSIDFLLYRNDPNAPMIMFAPIKYSEHELAWSVSAEFDALGQHLKDFEIEGKVRDTPAYAGALQGQLRYGYLRVSATGIARDLSYVTRNVPVIPFETLPKDAQSQPEIFGALTADYFVRALRLTPGLGGGIQVPSSLKTNFNVQGLPADRTVVVRSQGDESILPYGANRVPIYQARLSLRWDMSEMLSATAWIQYVRDNNGTLVVQDPTNGTSGLRVFQSPDRLGAAVSVQARF